MSKTKLNPCNRNDAGDVVCAACSMLIPEEACTQVSPPEEGIGVCKCICKCPGCGEECCCAYEEPKPKPKPFKALRTEEVVERFKKIESERPKPDDKTATPKNKP